MAWGLGLAGSAAGQTDRVFLGSLHSHTSYSDGSGLPAEAYRRARDEGGCDFFAITEHNHGVRISPKSPRTGQQPIARQPSLYGGDGSQSLVSAAGAATSATFVALYGQEFSTISSGNHVCVFDTPAVITSPSGQFDALVAALKTPGHADSTGRTPILQFNHPARSLREKGIEYGADDFGSQDEWLRTMGALACTIEVVNGPGLSKRDRRALPRPFEAEYRAYLALGFRLAPTADQDNHYRTWGTLTTARTGIIAPELTKEALLAAIRARHVYAATDKNLRVIVRINGRLCGDIIDPPADGTPLAIDLLINDGDEPNAKYSVQWFDGQLGGPAADASPALPAIQGNQHHHLQGPAFRDRGQYVFLRIRQTNKNNSKDTVWTAPVWFTDPVTFDPPP